MPTIMETIDIVETTGIVFLALALIYVIARLEMALRLGRDELKVMILSQQKTLESQKEIFDSIERVWRKVDEHNERLKRLEKV